MGRGVMWFRWSHIKCRIVSNNTLIRISFKITGLHIKLDGLRITGTSLSKNQLLWSLDKQHMLTLTCNMA